MYVHESSVGYTLYIQNDYYANQSLEETEALASGQEWTNETYDSSLDDYLNKIIDSIPELKSAQESGIGIGVVILPESASSTLKEAVSQTTDKMLDEGTDEDILKGVLGIVKFNYSADIEYGQQDKYTNMHTKNESWNYDMDALNNLLSKFQEIYGSNEALSAGLSKFSEYLNVIYNDLTQSANPSSETATSTGSSEEETSNDLVESLMQELENSEEGTTTGSEELTKKLYKDYIKSLSSSLTGGLLKQSS